MTRALSYLRRHGFLDMWFLFFAGYMAVLLAATIVIGTHPEVLEL